MHAHTNTHVMGHRFCVSPALSAGCSPPGGRNVGSIAVRRQVQTESTSGVINYRHRLPSSRIRLRFGHRDRSKRRWHAARHRQRSNSQRIGAAVERIVLRTRERDAQAAVASNERSPGPACIGAHRGEAGGGGGGAGGGNKLTRHVSLIIFFYSVASGKNKIAVCNKLSHAAHGWRIHCGVRVTELTANKQHTHSLYPEALRACLRSRRRSTTRLASMCRRKRPVSSAIF